MTKQELLDKANDLPLAPGVYLMMDKTGEVIYVGKAKKLKNRVSQYFLKNDSIEKTRRMVAQVDHFDTIFVTSEFEALILENSLIKQHMPRYNILLKDDKGYPFVRLGTERYPRFTMVGKPADDNALYFGPFGGRNETRAAIDAICAAFRLPTCSRKFPRDIGKERPCLNYHMGRCDGFCRGEPDAEEYQKRIEQACSLLAGHYKTLARELKTEYSQVSALQNIWKEWIQKKAFLLKGMWDNLWEVDTKERKDIETAFPPIRFGLYIRELLYASLPNSTEYLAYGPWVLKDIDRIKLYKEKYCDEYKKIVEHESRAKRLEEYEKIWFKPEYTRFERSEFLRNRLRYVNIEIPDDKGLKLTQRQKKNKVIPYRDDDLRCLIFENALQDCILEKARIRLWNMATMIYLFNQKE